MTIEHFEKALRAQQKRAPFLPLTVELVSGFHFQVDHPEALVLRAGEAVFVAADGTPTFFDHESVAQVIADVQHKQSA
ncbi:MAG: hypothetical protein ABSG53_23410 [Thermoguttaceae bacterium]|jgi:hypothetical protein